MEPGVAREVVLRFRDGTTERGMLSAEFSPGDQFVEVTKVDGGALRADFEGLKAVFFIKDPRVRELDVQATVLDRFRKARGAAARVEFFDGEVIHGRVSQYSVDEHGFFLYPTSPESNNEQIFVVVRALKTLYVETLSEPSASTGA